MAPWTGEVNRFCRQYLQLEPDLDYPRAEFLQLAQVQDSIYSSLFADGAVEFAPPESHQLRVLKELTSRIEASIVDWEEHVSRILQPEPVKRPLTALVGRVG